MEEEDYEKAFQQAQSFALVPILQLLNESIDYENNTGVCASKPGHINIRRGDTQAMAYIGIVSEDYDMVNSFNEVFDRTYNSFHESEEDSEDDKSFKELACRVVSHLIRSAYIVFEKFKEEEFVAEHRLEIDPYARIHLLGYDKYIAVKFQKL